MENMYEGTSRAPSSPKREEQQPKKKFIGSGEDAMPSVYAGSLYGNEHHISDDELNDIP